MIKPIKNFFRKNSTLKHTIKCKNEKLPLDFKDVKIDQTLRKLVNLL